MEAAAAADVFKRQTLVYGGSVNPVNAQAIFEQADVDGGLIGGASLDEKKFLELARLLHEV